MQGDMGLQSSGGARWIFAEQMRGAGRTVALRSAISECRRVPALGGVAVLSARGGKVVLVTWTVRRFKPVRALGPVPGWQAGQKTEVSQHEAGLAIPRWCTGETSPASKAGRVSHTGLQVLFRVRGPGGVRGAVAKTRRVSGRWMPRLDWAVLLPALSDIAA